MTLTAPARPAQPATTWPRPQLVHDHQALFVEPAYEDGQPYDDPDEEEDTEP
ncbi:hypothetical protein ACWGOK_36190 [Streptomyces eurythermus]